MILEFIFAFQLVLGPRENLIDMDVVHRLVILSWILIIFLNFSLLLVDSNIDR